eukprot:m.744162 g.744162  ORF g.744162 m.744162 type:complete len:580 (+) comp23123_c1_seq1:416-2155(+)
MEIDRSREHRLEKPPDIHPPTPEEGLERMATILSEPQESLHGDSIQRTQCSRPSEHDLHSEKTSGHERAIDPDSRKSRNRRRRKHRDRRTREQAHQEAHDSAGAHGTSRRRDFYDNEVDAQDRNQRYNAQSESEHLQNAESSVMNGPKTSAASPIASAVVSSVRDHRPPPQLHGAVRPKQQGKQRKPSSNPTMLALGGQGNATYFRDFDLKTKVRTPINPPLGLLPPEKYEEKPSLQLMMMRRSSMTQNSGKSAPEKGKSGSRKKEKPAWNNKFTKVPRIDHAVTSVIPRDQPKRPLIPGDLCRLHPSQLAVREYDNRYVSAKDWEILKRAAASGSTEKNLDHLLAPVSSSQGSGRNGQSAADGSMHESDNASPTHDQKHSSKNNSGTWRPRPPVETPGVLKAKAKFDPTAHIKRVQEKNNFETKQRVQGLLEGEQGSQPTAFKQQYRLYNKAHKGKSKGKEPKKWNTEAVKEMIQSTIKTEGYKLQALDELLQDLTKGRRAGAAPEKVVPTRDYIHKVRQRIGDLREAQMFVNKPTWYEDLKRLRVGGTFGTPLDQFLQMVKHLEVDDRSIVDDHPNA